MPGAGGERADLLPVTQRLKELEKQNQRLKQAVADLTVDNMILKEASKGNF